MIYVFDTGPLIDLFRYYYPDRFPSLWEKFRVLVTEGRLISVREVYNEIDSGEGPLADWAKMQKDTLFSPSSAEELKFVTEIFKVRHFQMMVRKKALLQGKPVADPFVIVRAKIYNGTVVTREVFKENSAQMPNVCKRFSINCISLEQFMQQEGWTF